MLQTSTETFVVNIAVDYPLNTTVVLQAITKLFVVDTVTIR